MGSCLSNPANKKQQNAQVPTRQLTFAHEGRVACLRMPPQGTQQALDVAALDDAHASLCQQLAINSSALLGFEVDTFGPSVPFFLLPRLPERPLPYKCVVHPLPDVAKEPFDSPSVPRIPLSLFALRSFRREECLRRQGYDNTGLSAASELVRQLKEAGYAILLMDDDNAPMQTAPGHACNPADTSAANALYANGPEHKPQHSSQQAAAGGSDPASSHVHAYSEALRHSLHLFSQDLAAKSRLVLQAPPKSKFLGFANQGARQFYQVRRCSQALPLPQQDADGTQANAAAKEEPSHPCSGLAAPAAADRPAAGRPGGRGGSATGEQLPGLSCRESLQRVFDLSEDVAERCLFAVAAVMGWDPCWVSSLLDDPGALPWQQEEDGTDVQLSQGASAADASTAQQSVGASSSNGIVAAEVEYEPGRSSPQHHPLGPAPHSALPHTDPGPQPGSSSFCLPSSTRATKHALCGPPPPTGKLPSCSPLPTPPPVPNQPPIALQRPSNQPSTAAYRYGSNVMRIYRYLRRSGHAVPSLQGPVASGPATGLHTDMGLLTVAARASLPGLCILHPTSFLFQQVEESCPPNAYVVFVGEVLAVLCRGALKAPVHYVDEQFVGQARISWPFFLRPRAQSVVWPTVVPLAGAAAQVQLQQPQQPTVASLAEQPEQEAGAGNEAGSEPGAGQGTGKRSGTEHFNPLSQNVQMPEARSIGGVGPMDDQAPPDRQQVQQSVDVDVSGLALLQPFSKGSEISLDAFVQHVLGIQRPWTSGYMKDY